MKKSLLVPAMLLLSMAGPYVLAQTAASDGTISFSGQIVEAQSGQQLTTVTPKQTTDASGSPQTVYVVRSAPTGETLATFPTQQAAQAFAAQVTPNVAYRTP
jgi:hypothetical protein